MSTRFRINPKELLQEIGGTNVLLDITSGHYFELNSTGALALRALSNGATREQTVTQITARFDAESAQVEADLETLISQLLERNLLTIYES